MKNKSNAVLAQRQRLNAWYHGLIKKASMTESDKEALLSAYGVSSSKDLSDEQLLEVCEVLQRTLPTEVSDVQPQIRRLRSRVITLLETLGHYSNTSGWERANAFLRNPRIAGRTLSEIHDEEELKALIRKLSAMARAHTDQLSDLNKKAMWN